MPPVPCKAAIGLWIGSLVITLLWAKNPGYSASELKVDVGYSLSLFLAFYVITQSARELRIWVFAVAKGSLVISLLAIVSFVWYGEWVLGYQNARGEFATCMITALPAILLLTLRNVPWSHRAGCVMLALPVILVAGALTMSRMFLGALILMILVIATLQAWRRRLDLHQGFILTAGIVCALAAIAILVIAQQRGVSLTDDARPAIWDLAMRQIAAHPWTGTGYGRLADGDLYVHAFPNAGIWHPHNLLLGFAEQAGIFGALGIIAVFLALGREYWKLYRSADRALSYIGVAGLAMLTGVVAKNMTDMFFVRECALLFWSLNGIFLGYARHAVAPAR